MGLAKHHEEILQKILDNFDSLTTDNDLNKFVADHKSVWNARLAKFEDKPVDPNGPKYDLKRATLNLIKDMHAANLRQAETILDQKMTIEDKIKQINQLNEKIDKSRRTMKSEYIKIIKDLELRISQLTSRDT